MKALIIVESRHCGNTRKVAEAMARVVPDAIVTDTEGAKSLNLREFGLIGFGSGIYAGSFDKRILRLVNGLSVEPAKVFVFSTSGGGDAAYNQKPAKLLEAKNKTVVGSFACKGLDKFFFLRLIGGVNKGCPTEEELRRAGSFLKGIAETL